MVSMTKIMSLVALMMTLVPVSVAQTDRCGLSPELEESVNRLLQSGSHYNYSGTLLVEYGSDREFVAVNARQGQDNLLTRLSRRAGAPLETVIAERREAATACSLARLYAFSAETPQVVAGRATWRLSIRPRDTLRLGYLMDIDVQSDLPLRVVSATPDGQVLERFEFAQFQLGDHSQAVQLPTATPKPISTVAVTSTPRFRFAGLPPGFTLVGRDDPPVAHAVVSDGLASASVFIEPQPKALAAGEGVVLRGSTLTYTRGTPNSYLITVMGEVPITTARLFVDAVRVMTNGS